MKFARPGAWALAFALTLSVAVVRPSVAMDIAQTVAALNAERERLSALPENVGTLPVGVKFSKKSQGASVVALRQRLIDLRPELAATLTSDSYDGAMIQAVTDFQRANGVDPDGYAGPATLEELNRPIGRKIERIALNISRLETMARDLAKQGGTVAGRMVVVNVPSFSLTAYENGRPVIESKTIVGRPVTQTPELVSYFQSLKFNPDWTPAETNEKKYLAALAKKDFKEVASHGLVVVDQSGATVPLEQADPEKFSTDGWRFWQPPGKGNALGLVKFEIKNRNRLDIYLHDTNERFRFARDRRAYSSGCVRVERYEELAAWLTNGTVETIRAKVARKATYWEPTPHVPLVIAYLTATADKDGRVVWNSDVYGLDHAELAKKPSKTAMR